MQGTILGNGILRGEDGNRYCFVIENIENLNNHTMEDLGSLQVDFEPQENYQATSLFILNNKQETNTLNTSSLSSECQLIDVGFQSKFNCSCFLGIVHKNTESVTSHTMGGISNVGRNIKGAFGSLIQRDKSFKMGDKIFTFDINGISKTSPLFALMGGNPLAGTLATLTSLNSKNVALEDGDKIIVAATNSNKGYWQVEALKNLTKDYHQSHIKEVGAYYVVMIINILLAIPLAAIIGGVGTLHGSFIMGLILYTPIFLLIWFFARKIYKIKDRKRIDEFIKNYRL